MGYPFVCDTSEEREVGQNIKYTVHNILYVYGRFHLRNLPLLTNNRQCGLFGQSALLALNLSLFHFRIGNVGELKTEMLLRVDTFKD